MTVVRVVIGCARRRGDAPVYGIARARRTRMTASDSNTAGGGASRARQVSASGVRRVESSIRVCCARGGVVVVCGGGGRDGKDDTTRCAVTTERTCRAATAAGCISAHATAWQAAGQRLKIKRRRPTTCGLLDACQHDRRNATNGHTCDAIPRQVVDPPPPPCNNTRRVYK